MITLQLFFNDVQELQTFLEQFPDSKKYLEFKERTDRIRTHQPFTQFEDDHIIYNYDKKSAKRIAEDLQRTRTSISQRAFKLQRQGLIKKKKNMPSRIKISHI